MDDAPLEVNGWRIYMHPAFLDPLEALVNQVEQLRQADSAGYAKKNAAKLQAAILHLIMEAIPADPGGKQFRQGNTLGGAYAHWRRAKFFQQYRLFFRYSEKERVIVLGWVNDDNTKRAYGSKHDAYRVFKKRLAAKNPPSDWDELLQSARTGAVKARAKRLFGSAPKTPTA